MADLSTFGARLRYLRKRKGLTQAEAALEGKVARSTYTGYENGGDMPARETLIGIADKLEASLDWIEGRTHKVNMPELGQFVNDPNELALLELWRGMSREMRLHLLGLIQAAPFRSSDIA